MSGLEVLGAVASTVAIVQAIQGISKAVILLRESRDARQKCDDLMKEIDTIQSLIPPDFQQVISLSSHSPSPPEPVNEHPAVSKAARELQEIRKELEEILDVPKTRSRLHPKWVKERLKGALELPKKIDGLRIRAKTTKENLHLAISFQTSSLVAKNDQRHDRVYGFVELLMTTYIQQASSGSGESSNLQGPRCLDLIEAAGYHPNTGQQATASERVTELLDEEDSSETSVSSEPTAETPRQTTVRDLSIVDRYGSDGATHIRQERFMQVFDITPLGSRICGEDCICQCHSGPGRYNGGGLLQAVLGSVVTNYRGAQGPWRAKCTESGCYSGTDIEAKYEYKFPRLLANMVLLQKFPLGITRSLRPVRTIHSRENFWSWIWEPSELQKRISDGLACFPDDVKEDDENIIHCLSRFAIRLGKYQSVEILLELWKNMLQSQQRLPRSVGYRITWKYLHDPSLKNNRAIHSVLQKTSSFVEGGVHVRPTRIHRAVRGGDLPSLQQALLDQPLAINELDGCGFAPIHWAVRQNNVQALERLIDAGSDINQRDGNGSTPLMTSALVVPPEAMRTLLKHRECRRHINQHNNLGNTALHLAVQSASVEGVKMLLDAGASVGKRNLWGRTPLHNLALTDVDEEETAHAIVWLLQERQADLEAQDEYGDTPATEAIRQGKLPVLRALVDAGASLTGVAHRYKTNALHRAALLADVETMSFLASSSLDGIDPKLRDHNHDTPLGALYWAFWAADWELIDAARRPSGSEQDAFLSLYFEVLSRHLQCHISRLGQLLEAAEQQDASTSSHQIRALIEKHGAVSQQGSAGFYRGIEGHLKNGNWDVVIRIVQEELEDAHQELDLAIVAKDGHLLTDPEVKAYVARYPPWPEEGDEYYRWRLGLDDSEDGNSEESGCDDYDDYDSDDNDGYSEEQDHEGRSLEEPNDVDEQFPQLGDEGDQMR